jgi:hypothetical protein
VGILIAALAMAIVIVALVAPAAANACTDSDKDLLVGQVTREGGTPVAYVQVKVLNGDTIVAEATTNWEGKYRVYVPAGVYRVKFLKYGYEPGFAEVEVTAPSTTLNMVLTKAPKLMGQVTKESGYPLAYVKVKVMTGETVVAEATTNWEGKYRVYVPAGVYRVKFLKYGYEPGFAEVEVTAPSTTLNMVLGRLP